MERTRKIISVSEVKRKLTFTGTVRIMDSLFTEDFDIDGNDEINCDGIVFSNCDFINTSFIDFNIKFGVKFYNCDIDNFVMLNSTVTGFNNNFSYHNCSLEFIDTRVKYGFEINNVQLERSIKISDNSTFFDLAIGLVKINNGSISIEKSTIKEICDINTNSLQEIRFENCLIEGQSRLSSNDCSTLTFLKTTFKRDLQIWGGTIKHSITFNDGVYEDDVKIKAVKSDGILTIKGDEFKTELVIVYEDNTSKIIGGCKEIYLFSCSFASGAYFTGSVNSPNLYPLTKIYIDATEKLKGEVRFKNFEIKDATLTGNNINGKIKFNHINFNKLAITDFTNSSKLQFFDVKSFEEDSSSFSISKSNMGNAEFYNTNLKSFKSISIKTSVLSDIVASNVTWFTKTQIDPPRNIERTILEDEWKSNRELYRQLKYAMEKQGNRIKSLDFKSYEMECYKHELGQQYYSNSLVGNRFILWLSQSNDYGLNYIKPFLLIIFFALICYSCIVVGVSSKLTFSLGSSCEDIKVTMNEFRAYFPAFFKMFNPLYDINKVFNISNEENMKLSSWVSFIDLFYRIVLSYLIFQLITAFRKFVK